MDLSAVTPAIFCKNEEYWISYVLQDLLKVFDKVIMLDTGSTDSTIEIAELTGEDYPGKMQLIKANYGDDPHKIGNSPNVLQEAVETPWMLLLAGDEILFEPQLRYLEQVQFPAGTEVAMIAGTNVADVNGQLRRHCDFHADKFFASHVRWVTTEYPFEGHNLSERIAAGKVYYLPGEFHYWHVRMVKRSSKDAEVYARINKLDYYGEAPVSDLPEGWPGKNGGWYNPYLMV